MSNMSKNFYKIIAIITAILGFSGIIYALPYSQSTQDVIPFVTDTYYIGTSSPTSKEYNGIFTKNLTVTGTCTGCSTGTIGSGTTGQFPFYNANGTTLTATSSLFITQSGNIGIGTTSPLSSFSIQGTTGTNIFSVASSSGSAILSVPQTGGVSVVAGTLNSGVNALSVSGTLSSTAATQNGVNINITGAGAGANQVNAVNATLSAGYTGSATDVAMSFANSSQGLGSDFFTEAANVGVGGITNGSNAAANNVGGWFNARNGLNNVGVFGRAIVATNASFNAGVYGAAANSGTANVGGFFALTTTNITPTQSAALMADNGSVAAPIFVARDNGTEVARVDDGGNVGIGTNSPSSLLHIKTTSSNVNSSIQLEGDSGTISQFYTGRSTGGNPNKTVIDNTSGNPVVIATSGGVSALGDVTVSNNSSNGIFQVGANTSSVQERVILASGGSAYNWQIASYYNIINGLEITPSTAAGGTSYTTPAITILNGGNVGIGTTTPSANFSIQTGISTGNAFVVATSSGNQIGGYDNAGHRFTSGPAPAISSCGTGTGTVVGDDQSGTITTATAATACTATFAKAYAKTPTCTVTDNSLVGFADIASISTTAVTFGISSALTGGNLYYSCQYHQ